MKLPPVTVTTNGHARELVSWNDLPSGELRTQFNYVIGDAMTGMEERLLYERFFLYRGTWYDVYEFSRIGQGLGAEVLLAEGSPFRTWDGVQTQSMFDAVLIRYPADEFGSFDGSRVIVGYATW